MRHSTKDNYLYLTTTPVPRLIVCIGCTYDYQYVGYVIL